MSDQPTPPHKVCPVCGRPFSRLPSRLARQVVCSPACRVARRNSLAVVAERLWRRVEKTPTCWLWRGPTQGNNDYGCFHYRGKPIGAHVFSWLLHNGPVPDGLQVLHSCDVPICVNPAHLFLGTHADNMRDRNDKGRVARGEGIAASKLTAAQVVEMRRLWADGISSTEIGRRFGVDRSTAYRVAVGELWPHVSRDCERAAQRGLFDATEEVPGAD